MVDVAVILITVLLTSCSLTRNGSFDIGLPADDPLLQMTANELTIDRRGLVIDGNGLLSVGRGTAGIDFRGFAIEPREWLVVDGGERVDRGFELVIEVVFSRN